MSSLSSYKKSSITSASQNTATNFEAFDVTNFKSVSFHLVKSGAGKGTLKLQRSNDGSNWVDVNTTANPDASGAVAAASSSSMVESDVRSSHVRAVFTEDNTGAVTVALGVYIAKQK